MESSTVPHILGGWEVIYADPPWRFSTYSAAGRSRSPDGPLGHYETMKVQDIEALIQPTHVATSAVLYLWATAPMLLEALDVMRAWGFAYKSQHVWDKEKIGTGYWARNQHEILLVGTTPKAKNLCPPPELRMPSVYREKATQHSRKPDYYHNFLSLAYPDKRKIELFARPPHPPGWYVWGNEVVKAEAL